MDRSREEARCLMCHTLSPFSSGKPLDLSLCSALNRLLHARMISQLQTLAPTEVPCPHVEPLVQRVAQSGVLEPFHKHCHIRDGAQYPWRCFSLQHEDSVFGFVVPYYLSQVKGIPQVVMPLLLLHCSKQMVLDPDPAELDPQTQPPDAYHPFLLTESPGGGQETSSFVSHTDHLIVRLKNVYHSCYLHTLHTALRRLLNYAPSDFALSMGVCRTAVVPVPCTHLIGGLCPHALLWQVGDQGVAVPVTTTNKLCQLLEGVVDVSAQTSRWRVSLQEGNSPLTGPAHCEDWGLEVERALWNVLNEEGFRAVPLNSGYYWYSGRNIEKEVTSGSHYAIQMLLYYYFILPFSRDVQVLIRS